jgi:hypothetical protein
MEPHAYGSFLQYLPDGAKENLYARINSVVCNYVGMKISQATISGLRANLLDHVHHILSSWSVPEVFYRDLDINPDMSKQHEGIIGINFIAADEEVQAWFSHLQVGTCIIHHDDYCISDYD